MPALGLNEPVRVCEACHFKVSSGRGSVVTAPSPFPNATSPATSKEDEDLQRAIAESLKLSKSNISSSPPPRKELSPEDAGTVSRINLDIDLERAIQESLREAERQKQKSATKSDYTFKTPEPSSQPTVTRPASPPPQVIYQPKPSSDLSETQLTNLNLFVSLVEAQAQEISQKGYGSFNPVPLQTLFAQVSSLHPQLTSSVQEAADKYKELYDMNTALTQVIQMYDSYLQQRLMYSQGGNKQFGGAYLVGQPPVQQPGYPLHNTSPVPIQNAPNAGPPGPYPPGVGAPPYQPVPVGPGAPSSFQPGPPGGQQFPLQGNPPSQYPPVQPPGVSHPQGAPPSQYPPGQAPQYSYQPPSDMKPGSVQGQPPAISTSGYPSPSQLPNQPGLVHGSSQPFPNAPPSMSPVPSQPPGYPPQTSQSAPGYPMGHPSVPPGAGYPPQQNQGYPPQQPGQGYPPQQPGQGYPPLQSVQGYPPQPNQGYPPSGQPQQPQVPEAPQDAPLIEF